MTALFEHNRTEWSLSLSEDEIMRVCRVIHGVSRRATDASVVWLTKVSPSRRLWIVRDGGTLVWVSSEAAHSDPEFALPLPEHFVEEMVSLAQTGDEVTLFCDESQDVIVCKAGERYLAVDHPREVEFVSLDRPYVDEPDRAGMHALAILEEDDVEAFARGCTNVPPRIDIDLYPSVQVGIGGGQLRWTMDWRRFGLWRVTKSVPARTEGEATVSFFPWLVGRVLSMMDTSAPTRMFVSGPDADFVHIVGEDWGVRVDNYPEQMIRWHKPLLNALETAGCQVIPHRGDRFPRHATFMLPGVHHGCGASVGARDDGTGETIVLWYVVASGVYETEGLVERVNMLNAETTGARVVLRDGNVMVLLEFPADDLGNLEAYLDCFAAAIRASGTEASFLPLFSV